MPVPTLLFPAMAASPTSLSEALTNLFQVMYVKIFMSGYTKIPTPTYTFLVSQRINTIQTLAVNFITSYGDPSLKRNLDQVTAGLKNNAVPHNALVGLIARGNMNDPFFIAISEWLILCYTETSAGDVTLPLIFINPDMSLSLADTTLSIDISGDDSDDIQHLPPFWRWLSYVTIGYSDAEDPFTSVCTEVIPHIAVPLSPQALTNDVIDKKIPLPNLINTLISLDVLFPDETTSPIRNDSFRRVMWTRWIKGVSPEVTIVGGDIFIIWSRLFDGITIGSTWARLQSAITGLSQPYQSAVMSSAFDSAALEAASLKSKDDDVDDPSEDPDAATADGDVGDNTSNDIDSTAGTGGMADLSDSSQVGKDQNSNAIGETGNTGTQNAAVQLGDTSTGNPVNAYIYRRSVLAVNKLLETDADLTVTHDARESLADWCRQWLWVADVSQTQKLIRELGLQKFVTQVKV